MFVNKWGINFDADAQIQSNLPSRAHNLNGQILKTVFPRRGPIQPSETLSGAYKPNAGFPLRLTNKIPRFFQGFKVFSRYIFSFVYPFSKINNIKQCNFFTKKEF